MMIKHLDASLVIKSLTSPSQFAVLSVLHEILRYPHFTHFSNTTLLSFEKVPECCDLEEWRQVDEKWWPQFCSSITQTKFLNISRSNQA